MKISLVLTAEKTYQPTTVRQQAAGGSFFRKAEEPAFFSQQERASSFFGGAVIQPKLTVSHPDDPQEKEADAMADQVMRMEAPAIEDPTVSAKEEESLQRLPNAAETPILSPGEEKDKLQRSEEEEEPTAAVQPMLMRQCAACAQEEVTQAKLMREADRNQEEEKDAGSTVQAKGLTGFIQPKANSPPAGSRIHRSGRAPPATTSSFESSLQSSKGGGGSLPLSEGTRSFMESRFGADFSGVRIHTGPRAEDMSRQISAHAFTHGNDIYFNRGQYAPHTTGGSRLLAHELTHTIQQGASPALSAKSKVARKFSGNRHPGFVLHRATAERPSPPQLSNAVAKAKGEEGKVNAGKTGPDGYRLGWERLSDYFKTTLGPEKVIGAGGSYTSGAVAEQDIKKQRMISGALPPAHPSTERGAPYVRDAMPSWCGIFVFWALHKAGVPMKPWVLGGRVMTPEAAYPPGHVPQAGDIAYRQNFSHFALVASTSGNTVTTVNGNTAGEDNLGGQVQTRDHPLSDWTAFFDPLLLKEGPLSGGETNAEAVRPLTLQELRQKIFHVAAKKEESGIAASAELSATHAAPSRPALSSWSVSANGGLQKQDSAEPEQQQGREKEVQEERTGGLHDYAIRKKALTGTDIAVPATVPGTNPVSYPGITASDTRTQSSSVPLQVQRTDSRQISNKGPPGLIQRNIFGDAWDAAGGAIGGAYDAASDFAGGVVDWADDQLNEAKGFILEKIRDYVTDLNGYRLLTVILQRDPVTGAGVARNGHTLLSAGLDVIPGIGAAIRTLLLQTGTWNEAAEFVAGRLGDFIAMVANVGNRVSAFINGLSVADIRHPVQVLEDFYQLIKGIIEDVVRFVCQTAEAFVTLIKRVIILQVAGFVQRRLPRLYPFLRVAFGFDPITNEQVPRNGTNILNAVFAVSDEGLEQKRQLLETGAFQKVAAWIDQGISVFTNLYHAVRNGFSLIWEVVSVDSLLHPAATFERIYDHFAGPVIQLWNWIRLAAQFIIQSIKDALLGRLSNWAKEQRGYFLITLMIGRDPFTQRSVPFSVENVIHAFMSLMDGGEAQFQQMKESGAVDRAANRITAAVRRLGFTAAYIIGLFTGLWRTLSLRDLTNPFALFRRVINTFAQPVRRLVAFVVEIVRIVVEVILQIMQFPTELIANIIARAMAAWERIKRDPIGFLKNLLRAMKQGFVQFFGRILDHLTFGLTAWLMAELRDAGVPALTDFSLRGVITWVLAVLHISMEAIWQKLASHPRIGPQKVARIRGMIGKLEGVWTFIKDVQERGMAAIWEKIQEQLSNLWETILEAVKNWVMEQIVNRVVARLLSMLDPTGIMAVINSAIAIYRAIQSFVRYVRQMLEIVNSFVMGVADIAAGNVRTAANYVEGAMRQGMPVVIGFLANQVGLSGIGRRVGELIGVARQKVDDALTWLVHKAVDTGFAVFERLLAMGKSAVSGIRKFLGLDKPFTARDGSSHHIFYDEGIGGARLMVASNTPVTIASLLRRVQPQAESSPDATVKTAYTNAVQLHTQIRGYETQLEGMPATPGPARQAVYDQLSNAMTAITPELSILMVVTTGPEPPDAVLPPFAMGVIAAGFEALYISSKTTGGETADKNSGATLPGWNNLLTHKDPLDATKTIRARDNYVKMHLLHHDLGGKAADSNLTPMKSSYNTDFYIKVEQFAVADKPSKVMWFQVQINYHPAAGSGQEVVAGIDYSAYPSRFIGKYGYMEHDATANNWRKTNNGKHEKVYASPSIPVPDFTGGARTYEMNAIGETTIASMTDDVDTMPESYAAIIATERRDAHDTGRHRKYASYNDLAGRLQRREQIRSSTGRVTGLRILNFLNSKKRLKFH